MRTTSKKNECLPFLSMPLPTKLKCQKKNKLNKQQLHFGECQNENMFQRFFHEKISNWKLRVHSLLTSCLHEDNTLNDFVDSLDDFSNVYQCQNWWIEFFFRKNALVEMVFWISSLTLTDEFYCRVVFSLEIRGTINFPSIQIHWGDDARRVAMIFLEYFFSCRRMEQFFLTNGHDVCCCCYKINSIMHMTLMLSCCSVCVFDARHEF